MPAIGWALVGVAAVVVLGLLVALALGVGGMLGERRTTCRAAAGVPPARLPGTQLPDEVPEAVEESEDDRA